LRSEYGAVPGAVRRTLPSETLGDRREVLDRIERQLGEQHGVVHVRRHRRDHEGVAVGRGLGDDVGALDGVRARDRVDEDLLAEPLRQLLGEDAVEDVDRAAGFERRDEADRLRRPGCDALRRCEGRQQRCRCSDREKEPFRDDDRVGRRAA
jgi:hypothetical protein